MEQNYFVSTQSQFSSQGGAGQVYKTPIYKLKKVQLLHSQMTEINAS